MRRSQRMWGTTTPQEFVERCPEYTLDEATELFRPLHHITAQEILELDIPAEAVLRVVLAPGVIDIADLLSFANACVQNAERMCNSEENSATSVRAWAETAAKAAAAADLWADAAVPLRVTTQVEQVKLLRAILNGK